MRKTLLLAGVACLFASQATAGDFFFKPYLGLDYVHSWTDVQSQYDADGTEIEINKDNMNAGAVSLGVKFHQNFALETFYQQSEKAKKNLGVFFIQDEYGRIYEDNMKTSVQYKAFGLDLIGSVPVYGKLEFLGTIGTGYYKAKVKLKQTINEISATTTNSASEHKWGIRVGAGLQYNFTEHLAARVMVRNTNTRIKGYKNLTDVTAGIRFYF